MSANKPTAENAASTLIEESGKDRATQAQSLRFTPLRSYVRRPRPLTGRTSGEPALSRIVPLPRLQS